MKVFYYFRNLGKRVLLGGARNKDFQTKTTGIFELNNIQTELERLLKEVVLPHKKGYTIEQRWVGIMGMGPEKKPLSGKAQPNLFMRCA